MDMSTLANIFTGLQRNLMKPFDTRICTWILHFQKATALVIMSEQGLIGPFWSMDENKDVVNVTADRYLQILDLFWGSVGRFSGAQGRQRQCLQQDGEPPNTEARDGFTSTSTTTWSATELLSTGRFALTAFGFSSLWGYLKDQISGKTCLNLHELRQTVEHLIRQISADQCHRVTTHFVHRAKKHIYLGGRHIQHVM